VYLDIGCFFNFKRRHFKEGGLFKPSESTTYTLGFNEKTFLHVKKLHTISAHSVCMHINMQSNVALEREECIPIDNWNIAALQHIL